MGQVILKILFCLSIFVTGWISTFIYYYTKYTNQDPEHTTGYFIANALNNSMPYIISITISGIVFIIINRVYVKLTITDDKKRNEAIKEANNIVEVAKNEADDIVRTAEYREFELQCLTLYQQKQLQVERQKLDEEINNIRQELEDEFKKKRSSYLVEISGLKAKLVHSEIKDEIIYWYGQGKPGAVDRLKKKLKNFNKCTFEKTIEEKTEDIPKEASKENEDGVDGDIGEELV